MCPNFHCNLTVRFTLNCCSKHSGIIVKLIYSFFTVTSTLDCIRQLIVNRVQWDHSGKWDTIKNCTYLQCTLRQFMSLFFPNFIQTLFKFFPNSILKLHKLTWKSLIISIKKMLLMARYLLVKLQPKISLNHNVQSQTNQKIDRQVRLCYFDDTAKVCKTSCISCFQMLRIKNS